MSGDYVIFSAGQYSGYNLQIDFVEMFNSGTLSSQLAGLAWTSATGGAYFRSFLQPQQGKNANLVGANFVGLSGQSLFGTIATVSGTPVDFTVIGTLKPNSWVGGANT